MKPINFISITAIIILMFFPVFSFASFPIPSDTIQIQKDTLEKYRLRLQEKIKLVSEYRQANKIKREDGWMKKIWKSKYWKSRTIPERVFLICLFSAVILIGLYVGLILLAIYQM